MRPSAIPCALLLVLLVSPAAAQRRAAAAAPSGPPRVLAPPSGRAALGPGAVVARRQLSSEDGLPYDALDASDFLGQSLARLGDLDGDGIDELAAGIQDFEANGGLFDGLSLEGAVLILFLAPDGNLARVETIDNHSPGFAGALGQGDLFGFVLAPLGDLDGDSVPDLAAGSGTGCGDCDVLFVLFLNVDGDRRSKRTPPGYLRPVRCLGQPPREAWQAVEWLGPSVGGC